jgi:hypothetical protein
MPGPNAPRFRGKPRVKDEIQTSFEEQEPSSPQLPSRTRFASSVSQHRDRIDEVDDVEDDATTSTARARSTEGQTGQAEDDDLADLKFLERLRGTRASQIPVDPEIESSSDEDKSFTPTASRKRRRLNNRTDHDFNANDEQVTGGFPAAEPDRAGDHENYNDSLSSASDLPSSPLTISAPVTSKVSSRFKIRAPTAGPTPANASTATPTTTRPSFRRPPDSHSVPGALHTNLPPAFSPSRRNRGRGRDYIPGGAADTVRNWILGLGAAEEHAQRRGHGGRNVERVRVAEVVGRDGDGRFVLVRDEEGRRWCLVGEDEASGSGTRKGRKRVEVGAGVGVRMGWNMALRINKDQGPPPLEGEEDATKTWRVAALWDVVDG